MPWASIVTVALQVVSWILGRNADDQAMQELFYKFVEKTHDEYLNSATAKQHADARLKEIMAKPFVETP